MAVILDRILDVLECCSQVSEGRSITEISEEINLHKSTVSRLANALLKRNYLVRDPQNKRFKLGLKSVELSYAFLNNLDIRKEAQSIMQELSIKTQFTAFLALQQGHDVVYIDKADGQDGLQRFSIIGYRAPLHATALGKALLMQMGREALHTFFSGYHFKASTLVTKTSLLEIAADIEEAKNRGYAEDLEENNQGVCCIASPIYDYRGMICASLSLSAQKEQWQDRDKGELVSLLRQASLAISNKLGYTESKI